MSPRIQGYVRWFNAVLSFVLIVLILIHGVSGGFMLIGINGSTAKLLSWATLAAALLHAAIGISFTVETLCKRINSTKYASFNASFWAIRASGLAILLLLSAHIGIFGTVRSGQFVLYEFTTLKLVLNFLLAAALAIHLLAALRPMLVALGFYPWLKIAPAALMFLAIILLFFTSAIVIYYIMWI